MCSTCSALHWGRTGRVRNLRIVSAHNMSVSANMRKEGVVRFPNHYIPKDSGRQAGKFRIASIDKSLGTALFKDIIMPLATLHSS